jgi:hypothetical protein
MIIPTHGRIVWYTPAIESEGVSGDARLGLVQHDKTKPLAAIVTHVWGDRCVNLTVFDSNGVAHPRTSVTLVQDGDPVNALGRYCEWMPYQKGQAAKTEAAEQHTERWKKNAAAAIGGG